MLATDPAQGRSGERALLVSAENSSTGSSSGTATTEFPSCTALLRRVERAKAERKAAENRDTAGSAAQLEVLYNHQSQRTQLSVSPRATGGVGGATLAQSTRASWSVELVAA